MIARPRSLVTLGAIVALLLAIAPSAVGAASGPGVVADHAVAVTPDPYGTRVALELLEDGGNAVDAAVGAALALAVTYPIAGNLGGGGFLLYRDPGGGYHALDHRETAPAGLTPEAFHDDDGRVVPDRSRNTGLAVGVPGTVAGLYDAHARWGRLPWRKVVRPSVRLASRGHTVTRWHALAYAREAERLAARPETRAAYTRDGGPLREGDRVVLPDLARTLRGIARHGPDAFYRGPVARAIVRSVAEHGGVLSLDDLASYRPVLREPLHGTYRGHRVTTFPPPSSGGVALLQMLSMTERYDPADGAPGSSLRVHREAEVARRAFVDRARWIGDPDRVAIPIDRMLDPDALAARAAEIDDDRATPTGDLSPPAARGPPESRETLHLTIVDDDGGIVALTTTLNAWFGSFILADGTGVLLNNEIDDFAIARDGGNLWNSVSGNANRVRGGARPMSSMTPTIVEDPRGRPILALGTPGGPTIITTVFQVLVRVLDDGLGVQAAVEAPRFHHQGFPDRIVVEREGAIDDVVHALEARGHAIEVTDRPIGAVAAIGRTDDGRWVGAADPRRAVVAEGR